MSNKLELTEGDSIVLIDRYSKYKYYEGKIKDGYTMYENDIISGDFGVVVVDGRKFYEKESDKYIIYVCWQDSLVLRGDNVND